MKVWKLLLLLACLLVVSNVWVVADESAESESASETVELTPEEKEILYEREIGPDFPRDPSGYIDGDAMKPKRTVEEYFNDDQMKALEATKETFTFQAEVNRLMDIIINSLYKNREVFLRELISNASDALDKIRFLSLSNPEVLDEVKDLEIRVSFDEDLKTLTIRDTGIGMTKSDLINNLGTVARSGTNNFAESVAEGQDTNLIGQFGVGFYSVYLVADRVRVVSKNPYDDQYVWDSTADSNYNISPDPRGNTLGRGTEITIFLRDDCKHEYTNQVRIEEILHKHSDFITFPIYLHKKYIDVKDPSEVNDDDEDEDDDEEEEGTEDDSTEEETTEEEKKEEEKKEEESDDKKPKPKPEPIRSERWEWERMNSNTAIWARSKSEITDEDYRAFFKAINKQEPTEAMTWIHFRAEGEVEFQAILYVPQDALNLYDEYKTRKAGVRLYVRKVLIQDDFEDLLPAYLNFIRGVVDSNDLPLNVSRETLQEHKVMKVMAKKIVRKVLEMLRKLSTGEEDDEIGKVEKKEGEMTPYLKFWDQFGKSIKMGVIEDQPNRIRLKKLLRYKSFKSPNEFISLDEYVKNRKEWQKDIYYIAGETQEILEKSPFLEVAKKKDIDVIYMTEPIDEYCVQHMADYEGYRFQSLTKEGLKFGDEDEEIVKKRAKYYRDLLKPLLKYYKKLLGPKVLKVSVSQRVENTPAVIVTSKYGNTANMERVMRAQTLQSKETVQGVTGTRTFELNPRHPIILKLNEFVKSKPKDEDTRDLAMLLYDTALQTSGFINDEPEQFSNRVYKTIGASLHLENMNLEDEVVIKLEEDDDDDDDDEEISLDNNNNNKKGKDEL